MQTSAVRPLGPTSDHSLHCTRTLKPERWRSNPRANGDWLVSLARPRLFHFPFLCSSLRITAWIDHNSEDLIIFHCPCSYCVSLVGASNVSVAARWTQPRGPHDYGPRRFSPPEPDNVLPCPYGDCVIQSSYSSPKLINGLAGIPLDLLG